MTSNKNNNETTRPSIALLSKLKNECRQAGYRFAEENPERLEELLYRVDATVFGQVETRLGREMTNLEKRLLTRHIPLVSPETIRTVTERIAADIGMIFWLAAREKLEDFDVHEECKDANLWQKIDEAWRETRTAELNGMESDGYFK